MDEDIDIVVRLFERSPYTALHLEQDETAVSLSRADATAQAEVVVERRAADSRAGASDEAAVADRSVAVVAPVSGTFYRAPTPGAAPFCEVGDKVEPDSTLGLIEIMKLWTSVTARQPGRVARIAARDGAPVQAGEPLIYLNPDRAAGAAS